MLTEIRGSGPVLKHPVAYCIRTLRGEHSLVLQLFSGIDRSRPFTVTSFSSLPEVPLGHQEARTDHPGPEH